MNTVDHFFMKYRFHNVKWVKLYELQYKIQIVLGIYWMKKVNVKTALFLIKALKND